VSKLMTSIGLMSGTSLDGIDVALIKTDGSSVVKRGPAETFPYTEDQRALLRRALKDATSLRTRTARPGALADAETAITSWHTAAVQQFLRKHKLQVANIDLIGFHGQTVLHRPEQRLTIQLGDGQALANATGMSVVYDLRQQDVSEGGQGAPLVPVYHQALSMQLTQSSVAFVNIGGVANITYVANDTLIAFDTGPGNALIDDFMLRHSGRAIDPDGAMAAGGRVSESVVAQFLGDSYFEMPGPKSLDRNAFNGVALDGLSVPDGAATLVAVTARSIAHASRHFPEAPAVWIICGGGRKNASIITALKSLVPVVKSAEDCGFNGDSMEAEAWAYLAVRSQLGLPISFPATTGVLQPMTGGLIARPRA
jgi:anhydro-N-acetylmuramic acid kinase